MFNIFLINKYVISFIEMYFLIAFWSLLIFNQNWKILTLHNLWIWKKLFVKYEYKSFNIFLLLIHQFYNIQKYWNFQLLNYSGFIAANIYCIILNEKFYINEVGCVPFKNEAYLINKFSVPTHLFCLLKPFFEKNSV